MSTCQTKCSLLNQITNSSSKKKNEKDQHPNWNNGWKINHHHQLDARPVQHDYPFGNGWWAVQLRFFSPNPELIAVNECARGGCKRCCRPCGWKLWQESNRNECMWVTVHQRAMQEVRYHFVRAIFPQTIYKFSPALHLKSNCISRSGKYSPPMLEI